MEQTKENILSGILIADTEYEIEAMTRIAAEYWVDGKLSAEEYKTIMRAAIDKKRTLVPETPATKPAAIVSKSGFGLCRNCGAELPHTQVMMGSGLCVECVRNIRNRHAII